MGVSFDDGQGGALAPVARVEQPGGLAGLFIRLGIASTPAAAQTATALLAVLMLAGSAVIYFVSRPKPPVVSEEEREELLLELKRGADGRSRLR